MRVVFFLKIRHLSASGIGIQVFIDGVRVEIDAINGCSGAYGGRWNEEHTAFIIPDVPENAIEIKNKTLTIHEPEKEVIKWTGFHSSIPGQERRGKITDHTLERRNRKSHGIP